MPVSARPAEPAVAIQLTRWIRPTGERFHRTSERLESGAADSAARAKFADLSPAMHHLNPQTFAQFYTQTEKHG